MKRLIIILVVMVLEILGIEFLKNSSLTAQLIWNLSDGGVWLLPLVIISSLLDSVHPCSFSILLITIAFLFGLQMSRRKILLIGGVYVAGIFIAYFFIGLGILQVFHLFNTPHFMGKLGAGLLIIFGLINLINSLFPQFPIKFKIPTVSHQAMGRLIEQTSIFAALILGLLVGICQFPCMGGPYLMVIGLLHDQVTYFKGVGYLFFYNLILIVPLVAVLYLAADKLLVEKMEEWKKSNLKQVRLWVGLLMIILGFLIFFI